MTTRALLAALLPLLVACGSSSSNVIAFDGGGGTDARVAPPDAHGFSSDSGGGLKGAHTLQSITVSPASATITSVNGASVAKTFTATANYADGTMKPLTSGIAWTVDEPQVGSVDGSGRFSANGVLGGVVHVTATSGGLSGSAALTVILQITQNPASLPTAVQSQLTAATTADTVAVWAYPYDGTVWPRGLLPPVLQWFGGAATDDYYVGIQSSTFDLELFTTSTGAPSSQIALDATTWEKLTDSSSGATTLTVARWDGSAATVVTKQTWTIASGSMRGTIYYWSNNLGRVLRIAPGASAPVDFANQAPLTDPSQFQQNGTSGTGGCLMTCHTVSADGSTLVSGGGVFGGTYSLLTDQPIHSLGGTWDLDPNAANVPVWENIQWEVPALSPNGQYILTNSMAQSGVSLYNGPNTDMGLFNTTDGGVVANSGVAGTPFSVPAWSPDGSRVAFVDCGQPSTWNGAWQNPPAGPLDVIQFDATKNPMFSGQQELVQVGTGKPITWPSVSPDGQWIVYARADSFDTRQGYGDLYLASAVTPNQEARLAKLDGDNYKFAAGARDLSWNYEPSFAPVAAGGYFWVAFTSRRTYGNVLTGQAEPCGEANATCASDPNCATDCATVCACDTTTEVKQIWVAAIDQNPKPGVDPSHAAFHLTGQDEQTLAMRAFWSLPPCAADGQSCSTGTDCCGGYCSPGGSTADGGTGLVCAAAVSGCAAAGDRCTTSGNCCDAASGVTCINQVCSEPTPK